MFNSKNSHIFILLVLMFSMMLVETSYFLIPHHGIELIWEELELDEELKDDVESKVKSSSKNNTLDGGIGYSLTSYLLGSKFLLLNYCTEQITCVITKSAPLYILFCCQQIHC